MLPSVEHQAHPQDGLHACVHRDVAPTVHAAENTCVGVDSQKLWWKVARLCGVLVVLLAVVGLAGCGDGASQRRSQAPLKGSSTVRAHAKRQTASVSSAVVRTNLRVALAALMTRYDKATTAIMADPGAAAVASDPRVVAYRSLFVSGSSFPTGALAAWAQEGAQGRAYRPGPRGKILDSRITDVSVADRDKATFDVCPIASFVIVDASGQEIGSQGGTIAARGVAVRENNEWRLRELSQVGSQGCANAAARP